MRSWSECPHLTTDGEATEIWTSHGDHLPCGIGEAGVALPEGGVDPLKEEALLPAEKGTGARVHGAIEAGPETDDTDRALSPQVTTVATDIGATQSLRKGLRKVTRRAGEETSNGFILTLVQMASCEYESICLSGMLKISSQAAVNILDFSKSSSCLVVLCFYFHITEVLSFVSL